MAININQQTLSNWMQTYPLLQKIMQTEEVFWKNLSLCQAETVLPFLSISTKEIEEAANRLTRFASFIKTVFPETKSTNGIIESELKPIPAMHQYINQTTTNAILGKLLLKCDHDLPIAGSIKARGGIYEVLKFAEQLAIEHNLLTLEDDYAALAEQRFKDLFSRYSIAVGSTGNLGLSIGIISAKLGFNVTVHMSADAKQWKKDLLRSKGVRVVEYESDYGKAVEEGRKQAAENPMCHFIDDEHSTDLFLGYAVAAERLKAQLDQMQITVDEKNPLFVYLPCGVGGGPGGITFGLKAIYGDHVHCFFVEPTHSPCMLAGLMTGLHDQLSVHDIGLDNRTEADGLAVGRPSSLVSNIMDSLLNGIVTVEDRQLFFFVKHLIDREHLFLEPSAAAGFAGPTKLFNSQEGKEYLADYNLQSKMKNSTHIIWATGGRMVPKEEMAVYYQKGVNLNSQ
ncbi:D-serine ammonia-lyase [Priestia megaterium]|nr:D-serine ammonia-lyase [Priestia megaterium]